MYPPWIAYPLIPWTGTGWRMGSAEEYWADWLDWYQALESADRLAYEEVWPQPIGWRGFFESFGDAGLPTWWAERPKLQEAAARPLAADERLVHDYFRILWLAHHELVLGEETTANGDEIRAFLFRRRGKETESWRLSVPRSGNLVLAMQDQPVAK